MFGVNETSSSFYDSPVGPFGYSILFRRVGSRGFKSNPSFGHPCSKNLAGKFSAIVSSERVHLLASFNTKVTYILSESVGHFLFLFEKEYGSEAAVIICKQYKESGASGC